MTYELEKELKDAGFNHCLSWGQHPGVVGKEDVPLPTLSELIEACGDGFEDLSRDTSTEEVLWTANAYRPVDVSSKEIHPIYEGSTPEEAVARLWLALNKKA